jgi:hypothetical protein
VSNVTKGFLSFLNNGFSRIFTVSAKVRNYYVSYNSKHIICCLHRADNPAELHIKQLSHYMVFYITLYWIVSNYNVLILFSYFHPQRYPNGRRRGVFFNNLCTFAFAFARNVHRDPMENWRQDADWRRLFQSVLMPPLLSHLIVTCERLEINQK